MIETTKLKEVKILLKSGQIDYDQAMEMAKPLLQKINEKVIEISKEHKRKPKLITFIGFMR